MIRLLLSAFALFTSTLSLASHPNPSYDLKMELSLDGKKVFSPRVIAKQGKTTLLTEKSGDKNNFIEVVATETEIQGSNAILMKFAVGTIDRQGKKTIISRPQLFAQEAEPLTVRQINTGAGQNNMSLSVTAYRKGL